MLDSKLIVIPHRGPIYPKAGIYGPIQTPYLEKTSDILALLNAGYPVVEVLADKTEVPLNYHNYAKDNSGAASAHAEVDAPVVPPVKDPVVPAAPVKPTDEQAPLSKQERKRLKRLEEEQKKAEGADSDVTPAE